MTMCEVRALQRHCRDVASTVVEQLLHGVWIAIVKAIEKITHWIWGMTYDYLYKMKGVWIAIVKAIEKITHWIWGTTYDYLYKMKVEGVHPSVLDSETREYEDAGLLLNSPYFSVLRKERDIDLIISLDYSASPFMIVKKCSSALNMFVSLGEVQKWNRIYSTFNMSYNHEEITALLEKAAENIKNNKDKLLKEI
ncbi:hypothetical protein AOLI_G00319890 [Acnodon oligacanthus]